MTGLCRARYSFCSALVVLCVGASAQAQTPTVVLFDDFNGPTLDTSVWGTGDWLLGRTRLGNPPTFGQETGTTFATLAHDTYNPSDPGSTFTGAELLSLSQFTIGAGKEFETRVRVSSETRGLVMSFFSWGARGTNPRTWETDEIDFEYLSNLPTDAIQLTAWNDWKQRYTSYNDGIHHSDQTVPIPGFLRGGWNVLRFRCLPDRIEWYVNDVLVWTNTNVVPNDPMNIRLNFWAPDSSWAAAYDAGLQPTANPAANQSYRYDVDYVKVSTLDVTHSITASAGTGGSITPAGTVAVADGGSQAFVIAPSSGYAIADVQVDGVSVGVVSSYTFTAVHAAHTINAVFSVVTSSDVVTVLFCSYKPGKKELSVGATSSQQPTPTLTLVGHGNMSWQPSMSRYFILVGNVAVKPSSVTVVSSAGGSASCIP
jgi:hypothetical protein